MNLKSKIKMVSNFSYSARSPAINTSLLNPTALYSSSSYSLLFPKPLKQLSSSGVALIRIEYFPFFPLRETI